MQTQVQRPALGRPAHLLSVVVGGSLAAAARRLGVNHSTVFRRINALEARLGLRLFERLRSGYLPTAAGSELLASAERIETELLDVERRLAGRDLRLTGAIRLTAPDDVAEVLLSEPLARFRVAYPEITLELDRQPHGRLDPARGRYRRASDASAAREPSRPLGRKSGQRHLRGELRCCRRTPICLTLAALAELPWIGWDEGCGSAAIRRWMAAHIPSEQVIYKVQLDAEHLHRRAGRASVWRSCLAFWRIALANCGAWLRPMPGLVGDLWLLTHPDLRHTARIRALLDALYRDLRGKRATLAGQPLEIESPIAA